MAIQLKNIRAASLVYASRNDGIPWDAYGADLNSINDALSTSILPNGATYTYYGGYGNDHFWVKSQWNAPGSANDFQLEVSQHPITDPKNPPACANPCCEYGPCTYLGSCCYC
jgi:hypothetical protein